jgi:hypothetical protein
MIGKDFKGSEPAHFHRSKRLTNYTVDDDGQGHRGNMDARFQHA